MAGAGSGRRRRSPPPSRPWRVARSRRRRLRRSPAGRARSPPVRAGRARGSARSTSVANGTSRKRRPPGLSLEAIRLHDRIVVLDVLEALDRVSRNRPREEIAGLRGRKGHRVSDGDSGGWRGTSAFGGRRRRPRPRDSGAPGKPPASRARFRRRGSSGGPVRCWIASRRWTRRKRPSPPSLRRSSRPRLSSVSSVSASGSGGGGGRSPRTTSAGRSRLSTVSFARMVA